MSPEWTKDLVKTSKNISKIITRQAHQIARTIIKSDRCLRKEWPPIFKKNIITENHLQTWSLVISRMCVVCRSVCLVCWSFLLRSQPPLLHIVLSFVCFRLTENTHTHTQLNEIVVNELNVLGTWKKIAVSVFCHWLKSSISIQIPRPDLESDH